MARDSMFDSRGPALNLDVTTEVYVSRKAHPEGKVVPVLVDGKETLVRLPLDVKAGRKLKYDGRGKYDPISGQCGDLYVLVHMDKGTSWRKKVLIPVLGVVVVACMALVLLKKPERVTPPATELVAPAHTEAECVHTWIPGDCKTPKVCLKCGRSVVDTAAHIWSRANYNAPQTCTVCGETVGEKRIPTSPMGLRDIISSVSASSAYSGDNLGEHVPENMYDGSLLTNWTENAPGNGVGEYVIFYFNDTYAVNKLQIYIGSHYSEGVYQQNCRPKAITLTFSDGSAELIALEDTYDEQIITLNQFYYTDAIKLTIEEVYSGTAYLDTVIAELDFVAYRP